MPLEILTRQLAEQNVLLGTLDRVMALAEFSPEGELLHANANFLAMLGYELEAIRGAHHRIFCDPAYVASDAYRQLWQRLRGGVPFSDLCDRRRRDGSGCWLEATYAPVLDGAGRVVKVIKIATDITERVHRERRMHEQTRRLSMVADATDNAVLITDSAWRIVYVNRGFVRMFGWPADTVLGREPIDLLAPQLATRADELFRQPLRTGRSVRREEIMRGRDGERYWCSAATDPVLDADGRLLNTVSVFTDITQSKMHEVLQHRVLEAMAREHPLAEVLELICDEVERIAPDVATSIREVDAEGRLQSLAAPKLPHAVAHRLDGRPITGPAGTCGTAVRRAEPVSSPDIADDPDWDGLADELVELGYVACWATPIRAADGRVVGTFSLLYRERRDTEAFHQRLVNACVPLCALALEREHSRARIRQLAFYDTLTGLPNRSLLHAKADQAIAVASRNAASLAVLFIDLDRFKQVNDSLGHPAGDELLRIVAQSLTADIRGSDVAGRLSGDEFVLLLSDCDVLQATDAVERLQARLARPCEVAGVKLTPSASVGIAMFPADGRDMDTLLHRADMAMYQAKSGGRGHFSFYSREMNDLAQERLALENALRQAIDADTLELHYQPQVDIGSGRLHGVEALARWRHPELGDISPSRFIPLAEDCGLIGQLGRWALRSACAQLADWRGRGLAVPSVSVNLSPTSFHDAELPRMVLETLERHALQPADLTLEITESVLIDNHPGTLKTIGELHARGVRLAMDDFGTGYSSLSYLRRLPIDELKLDRSFVSDLGDDETARELSRAVVQIGESLHLTVVAEGVETEAQHRLLADQGYHVAQGYLFAQPLPAARLAEWLAETAAARAAAATAAPPGLSVAASAAAAR